MAAAAAVAAGAGSGAKAVAANDAKDRVIWIELTEGMRFYSLTNPIFSIVVKSPLSKNRFSAWYQRADWGDRTDRGPLATYNVDAFTIRSSDGLPVYTIQLELRGGYYHADSFTVITPSESNAIMTLACPWPMPMRTLQTAYVIPKGAGAGHCNTIRTAYISAFAAYMTDISKARATAAAAAAGKSTPCGAAAAPAPAPAPASAAASVAVSR